MAYRTICILLFHVNVHVVESKKINAFPIESNEEKKNKLHAGNITTGATYTPLFLFLSLSLGLWICVHLFGIHHGNLNGVVAQKTLSFIITFKFSRYKLNQINEPPNSIWKKKKITNDAANIIQMELKKKHQHLPQKNATQQLAG